MLLPTLTHTLYVVPCDIPVVGQTKVPLNAPVDTFGFEPGPIGVNALQSGFALYPKVIDVPSGTGVLLSFIDSPEPLTLIVAPTGPDGGLLVIEGTRACA